MFVWLVVSSKATFSSRQVLKRPTVCTRRHPSNNGQAILHASSLPDSLNPGQINSRMLAGSSSSNGVFFIIKSYRISRHSANNQILAINNCMKEVVFNNTYDTEWLQMEPWTYQLGLPCRVGSTKSGSWISCIGRGLETTYRGKM